MKKNTFILLLIAIFTGLGTCNAKSIKVEQLPDKALIFLKEYFYGVKTLSVEKVKKTYVLTLEDDRAVTFDKKGEWISVACPQGIPGPILPNGVFKHVGSKYDRSVRMTAITRTQEGYRLKLSNGVQCLFNAKGEFVEEIRK